MTADAPTTPSRRQPWRGHAVIVTGASSGIGAAIARQLGALGASVALLARRQDRLAGLAAEINADFPGSAVAIAADISREDDVIRAIDEAATRLGRVDALINNAGVGTHASILHTPADQYERMFRTNVVGAVAATRAVLPHLLASASTGAGGRIVFTSSVNGLFPMPLHGSYGATKFALQCVADTLRLELAGTGVSVTTVCPGQTTTEFHGALLTPEGDGLTDAYRRQRDKVGMTADAIAQKLLRVAWRRRKQATVWYGSLLRWWYTRWYWRAWFDRFQVRIAKKAGMLPIDYTTLTVTGDAPTPPNPVDATAASAIETPAKRASR